MAFPGAGTPQNFIVCAHSTQTGKFVLRGSQGESFEKTPIIERTSFIQDLRSLLVFTPLLVRSRAILRRTRPNAVCIIAHSWIIDNQFRRGIQICVSPIIIKPAL